MAKHIWLPETTGNVLNSWIWQFENTLTHIHFNKTKSIKRHGKNEPVDKVSVIGSLKQWSIWPLVCTSGSRLAQCLAVWSPFDSNSRLGALSLVWRLCTVLEKRAVNERIVYFAFLQWQRFAFEALLKIHSPNLDLLGVLLFSLLSHMNCRFNNMTHSLASRFRWLKW